jgi:hypothetical protein
VSDYKFIEPLEAKPAVFRKTYRAKSTAQLVVEEFLNSGVKYAEIKRDVVSAYKTPATCARGFGRVIKTLGQSGNVKVYSDSDNVYLELTG